MRVPVKALFTAAAAIFAAAAFAQQSAVVAQKTFDSPREAADALVAAAAKNDTSALLQLFGPQGRSIVVSGDAAEDTRGRAQFAARASEKLEIQMITPKKAEIVTGSDSWPLPVPVIQMATGKWRFDAREGRVEVLARRIGRNELNAIDVCRGYVEAQMQYAQKDRNKHGDLEYAQSIVSAPGKPHGLYAEGQADGLVPKAFADAAAVILSAQGKKPQPYHGYLFHILKAQGPAADGGAHSYVVKGEMIGGFALVAWPAEYGVNGIHTFIVSHHGVVFERDLGAATGTLARQMPAFNPDKGWRKVKED
jgi:hypothetical protein